MYSQQLLLYLTAGYRSFSDNKSE